MNYYNSWGSGSILSLCHVTTSGRRSKVWGRDDDWPTHVNRVQRHDESSKVDSSFPVSTVYKVYRRRPQFILGTSRPSQSFTSCLRIMKFTRIRFSLDPLLPFNLLRWDYYIPLKGRTPVKSSIDRYLSLPFDNLNWQIIRCVWLFTVSINSKGEEGRLQGLWSFLFKSSK